MSKIDMTVILGEPGSGKSYDLIKKAIKLVKSNELIYIMTPTKAAKSRLINGFNDEYLQHSIDINMRYTLSGSSHILQENYKNEAYILIDEFSMITADQFYSLIYRCQINQLPKVHLIAYGDEKQLEPVHGVPALMLLLKSNMDKFKGLDKMSFWRYVQTMFYEEIGDTTLSVPNSWKLVVDSVELKIKNTNYRLQSENILGYNLDFYDDVLNNQTTHKRKYDVDLIDRAKKKYLFISPTHIIGQKIDDILNKAFDEKENAPFIRLTGDSASKVYINPYCKVDYGFSSFIPLIDPQALKDREINYSWYVTVHFCQGATVDNSVFCMLNSKITNSSKSFYSRNLLYVALTRAKYHSEYFGNPDEFRKMLDIYPDDGEVFINATIGNEAANQTYQMIIDCAPIKILTLSEIVNLFHKNFIKIKYRNERRIDEIKEINNDFEVKEPSIAKVMKMFSTENNLDFSQALISAGYGFLYAEYVQKERSKAGKKGIKEDKAKAGKIGGSIGGKVSQVQKWVDSLDIHEYNRLRDDCKTLSVRKFALKYGHKKEAVQKYVK